MLGNYIGTNIHGQMDPGVDLGNSLDGVIISRSSRRPYRVQQQDRRDHGRGTQRHFRQPRDGVSIVGDSGPIGNLVQGNYIGTDSSGTMALGQRSQRRTPLFRHRLHGQRLEQHHRRNGRPGRET